MDEKLKIFWNLDVLVKMCRSKSDGPSLRVEEEEILEKINNYETDIEEIKAILEDDTYDTSAEMADRNIEIITKKQLQSLKAELKEKNKELNKLKDEENVLYNQTSLLRENKASNEKYIASMQERLSESTDRDVLDRYNALITETLTKINELTEKLREENTSYEDVQTAILQASSDVEDLEARIDKKKKLLAETQASLENKDNYIDKTKREKNTKKIEDITNKIEGLQQRLEEIRKDPKYIETKIKDIINSKEEKQNARDYLSELVSIVIDQPYINVAADNSLEEELLRATQARDSFANEIDQKSYNILEANTPEKIRTDFLNKRIENWKKELERLHFQINQVDRDVQYNYEEKDRQLEEMIKSLKNDLREFEKAYEDTADTNIGAKASIEVALEEKKEDIQEAEKIANAFKTNEAEDIANATRAIKYQCDQLNNDIKAAEEEIKKIRNRLMSRKSGLIDIAARNKDKDVLKDLAQTVINIKHRRQFPETPIDIIKRLEEELDITILTPEDLEKIQKTSVIEPKNYDEFITKKYEIPSEEEPVVDENYITDEDKELADVDIMNPEDLIDNYNENKEEFQKLANQAMGIEQQPAAMDLEVPVDETPIEEQTATEEESTEEVEEPIIEESTEDEIETPEDNESKEGQESEEAAEEETESAEDGESDEETESAEGTGEEEPVIEEDPLGDTFAIEDPETEEAIEESTEEEAPAEENSEEETPVEENSEEETESEEEPQIDGEEDIEDITEDEIPSDEEDITEDSIEEEPEIDEETIEEVEEPIEESTEEPQQEEPQEEEIVEEEPIEEETIIEEAPVEEESIEETPSNDEIVEETVEEVPVDETTEEIVEEQPIEEEIVQTEPTETTQEEIMEQTQADPVEENIVQEEVPIEEPTPTEEEQTVEESTMAETPVEETVTQEPIAEEVVEETPAVEETVTEEPVSAEASMVEEPVVETNPSVEEQVPEQNPEASQLESTPVEQQPAAETTPEIQENPFGDAINPLEQETTEATQPQEEIVELSSDANGDLSINSMFSNSIELSDEKDTEEVRNNLSNELDNFLNNLDDENK